MNSKFQFSKFQLWVFNTEIVELTERFRSWFSRSFSVMCFVTFENLINILLTLLGNGVRPGALTAACWRRACLVFILLAKLQGQPLLRVSVRYVARHPRTHARTQRTRWFTPVHIVKVIPERRLKVFRCLRSNGYSRGWRVAWRIWKRNTSEFICSSI